MQSILPMKMQEELHVGKLIKERIDSEKLSNTEVSKRLGNHRTVLNHIFRQPGIEIHRLAEISDALEYDFISHHFCKRCAANRNGTALTKQLHLSQAEMKVLMENKNAHIVLEIKIKE